MCILLVYILLYYHVRCKKHKSTDFRRRAFFLPYITRRTSQFEQHPVTVLVFSYVLREKPVARQPWLVR